ncbi:uracil phosphoribosyltransferase, partial [Bacillus pumilus]|uniref:uracil phosphoribosyltransferase n=1 Tax=Bacillus pumilus TaxID=1408 RepID=UPI0034D962AC
MPPPKLPHLPLYPHPKTLNPLQYYLNLPSHLQHLQFILLHPILPTPPSALQPLNTFKERGPKNIRFICLRGPPEGVGEMQ